MLRTTVEGRQSRDDGDLTVEIVARLPVNVKLGKLIVFGHIFGGVREKSSRIKRKVEEDVDRSDIGVGNGKGGKIQSPSWVGIWTLRTTERVPYTCP